MADIFKKLSRSFAAAQASMTGPVVQQPGTETLHSDELTAVGYQMPKGKIREKGITLSSLDDVTKQKIEDLRKKRYPSE